MYCPNNDIRCREQGYCNCHDDTGEAAVGLGGLIIWILVGMVASFLYPAIKIMRSRHSCEANGAPKFAGTLWLFLSPLFGLLSNMLYQIVFAAGACAANALQSKVTNSIYIIGMFVIYILAIGLALIAFLFENWQAIKLFFTNAETRTGAKTLTLAGAGVMALLTAFAGLGIVAAATNGYLSRQAGIQAANDKESKTISTDAAKHDFYVGKYKFITRNDNTTFQVAKSDDGKNLRLIMNAGKTGKTNGKLGCLLSPKFEGNLVYYAVSECVVEEPISLFRVYFEVQKSRTTMKFIYNVKTNSDTLKKIK